MPKICRVGDPGQSLPTLLLPYMAEQQESRTMLDKRRVICCDANKFDLWYAEEICKTQNRE